MRAYKDTEQIKHKIHMKLRIMWKISPVSKYIEYQRGTPDYYILWHDGIFLHCCWILCNNTKIKHLEAVTIYFRTVILTNYWPHLSKVHKHLTSLLNNLKY